MLLLSSTTYLWNLYGTSIAFANRSVEGSTIALAIHSLEGSLSRSLSIRLIAPTVWGEIEIYSSPNGD